MESPASIMKTLSDERRFTDIFIAIPENNAIKTVQHFPVFRALQECISCIVFWDYKRKIGWVAGAGTIQTVKKAAAALEKMKKEASFTDAYDSKYRARLESLEKFDVE